MSSYPKRGEIYWVNLDPTVGSEIAKTRPALIVSNNVGNQYAATVSILPITSNTAKIYPYEVFVTAAESGLKKDSKVKANQIRTIDKQRVKGRISQLGQTKMEAVERAILIHLEIDRS